MHDVAKYVQRCMVYLQRANGQFKLYERHAAKKLYSLDCELLFRGKTGKDKKVKTSQTIKPAGKARMTYEHSPLILKVRQQGTMGESKF